MEVQFDVCDNISSTIFELKNTKHIHYLEKLIDPLSNCFET
jgi:hypothetical protein